MERKKQIPPIKKKFSHKYIIKTKINYFILKFILIIIIIILLSYIMKLPTLKRRAFDEFKPHKVFIEAHRGVNRLKFQNTKESIELAIKYGIDTVETDLWLSKDNVGVLSHVGRSDEFYQYYQNANFSIFNLIGQNYQNCEQ